MAKKKVIATNLRSIIITKCTMFSRGWVKENKTWTSIFYL